MALWFIAYGTASAYPVNSPAVVAMTTQANATPPKQCGPRPRVLVLGPDGKPKHDSNEPEDWPLCPPSSPAKSTTQPLSRTFPAGDRVDILPAPGDIRLAEEAELPLAIRAKGLVKVSSAQARYVGENSFNPGIFGSDKTLPVLYHPDGTAYIKVTPMGLGQVQLSIFGRFPDGGYFMKRTKLQVGVPEHKPIKLVVGQGGMPNSPSPVIFLQIGPHRNSVNVNALYGNVKELIEIPASFAKFTIRSHDDPPAIHLDESTGIITPIHVGQALVVTSFAGLKHLSCVIVTQNVFDGYVHPPCKNLLALDEALDLPSRERK
jgi:hypothetical protein